ncbi:MAG: DUF4142 domain-containing protein, partial [Rhodanobacter sp.]
ASQMPSQCDRQFLQDASAGNMAAIELGKLAVSQGTNAAVQAFGQGMLDDESATATKLRAIARSQQLALAALPSEAPPESRAALKRLLGDRFDHGYAKAAVQDRHDALQLVTSDEQRGTNSARRACAMKSLAGLQAQLALATKPPSG